MKRFTAFLIAVLLALQLSSCAGGDGETTAPETTAEVTSETAQTGIDLSEYKIIRGEKASSFTIGIASKFRADIKALGAELELSDDWLMPNIGSAEIAEYKEILVGSTNRPESAPDGGLSQSEGKISVKGNKIVLSAGSDLALDAVCGEFLKLLTLSEGKLLLDLTEEISVKADIPEQSNSFIVADQKASKVRFYTIDPADMTKAAETKSFEFERYNIAGLKLRIYGGKKVLIAAYGSRFGKMIDIETGEVLFQIDDAGNNPHSPELTPNGIFCIASSNGNIVKFYNVTDPSKQASVNLTDAHGVLYDPDTDRVFAVGRTFLRAYRAEPGADGIPVITEDKSRAFTLPSDHAHDLQPVEGNTDLFWITTTTAVYQYSVSEMKILDDFPGKKQVNVSNVKGIGNFPDGSIIFVTPDGKFESWTSEKVTYYHAFNGKFYKFDIGSSENGIYKVRPEKYEYQ